MKLCLFLIFLTSHLLAKTIVVISDLNGSYGSTEYSKATHQAIAKIVELKPDIVLVTGDMVAGQKAGLNYQAMWDSFHQAVTLPLREAKIPMAVTVGNHDGSGFIQFQLERKIFEEEWNKFKPEVNFLSDERYPFFYSFEQDDYFFASLDSTIVGAMNLENLSWLENELIKAKNKKHKILFTHVPIYHFNQKSFNESYYDQRLVELLKKYDVKFYLTGHHHTYYPGFADGIHHISQGCLGSGPRALIGESKAQTQSFTVLNFEQDHFSIFALKSPDYQNKIDHKLLPQKIEAQGRILYLKDSNL